MPANEVALNWDILWDLFRLQKEILEGRDTTEQSLGDQNMNITADRTERLQQKMILREIFPDYNPKHHDVFVIRYQQKTEKEQLQKYMKNRGLT